MVRRAVAVIALVAAACGRAAEPGVTTIRWAVGRDPTGGDEKLVAAFHAANPDIRVEIVPMSMDVGVQHDAYVTQLAAGDPGIDVYALDVIWTAEFAWNNWLRPVDTVIEKIGKGEFLPAPLASATYKGRIWAVPWFTDAGLLYVRRDILEEAGETVPETWDGLLRVAARLRRADRAGHALQAAQYEGLVCNFLEIAWAHGGDALDTDGNPRLDTPENAAALAFMRRLIEEAGPEGALAHKEEESRTLFTEGRAVFLRNWPYVIGLANDPSVSKVVGRYAIAPLPAGPAGRAAALGGWNIGISAHSRNPEAAYRFAEFLASPEAQVILALEASRLPVRWDVYEDKRLVEAAPHLPDLLEALKAARPRPVHHRYALVSNEIQRAVHAALSGRATPEAALAEAQRAIEAALR